MRAKMSLFLLFALFVLFLVVPVQAGTIGPNCPSCQGGIYNLSYNLISSAGGTDTLDLFLTVDTSAYTGGGLFINAVAPKVAPSLSNFTLLSSPLSSPAGTTWTTVDGGLNATGCSGAGAGFLCTGSDGLGADLNAIVNSWSWRIQIATGTLLDGLGEASVKVLYVGLDGVKVGALVSEPITLTQNDPGDPGNIPETNPIIVIGAGLIAVALIRSRQS